MVDLGSGPWPGCAPISTASMSTAACRRTRAVWTTASLASPKLNLIFGPWSQTEFFVNYGQGFHSNDARGTTITIDPKTGAPADRVSPLVKTRGSEVGVRTEIAPAKLAGAVEAHPRHRTAVRRRRRHHRSRASVAPLRRRVEQPLAAAVLDVRRPRHRLEPCALPDEASGEGGYRIPGAPDTVISAASPSIRYGPWSGALFLRYIGSYPLIEDNSVRADASTVVDGQIGYEIARGLQLRLDVFNLFDAKTSDISYFYTSRLPGEPAEAVDDVHFHPGEPRSFSARHCATRF